jgi:hypothetical protein
VVNAREVNHLDGERLLAEVVQLAKGDIELNMPEGHDFLPQHDPIEWRPAGAQVAPRDTHLVEGAGAEYVEAAVDGHQHQL